MYIYPILHYPPLILSRSPIICVPKSKHSAILVLLLQVGTTSGHTVPIDILQVWFSVPVGILHKCFPATNVAFSNI